MRPIIRFARLVADPRVRSFALIAVTGWWLAGCGDAQIDQALETDANGFICSSCTAKFYTERKVIASRCPSCQKQTVERVLGYHCPQDQHVTYAPRSRGAVACGQCGKRTGAVGIPRKDELKAWGAELRTAAEVGGL